MNIWIMTIVIKGSNQSVGFTFKTEETARAAYLSMIEPGDAAAEITDDFGCVGLVNRDEVSLVLICDYHQQLIGQQEAQLENMAAQARTQRRAEADPLMRGAGSQGNGRIHLPQ